MTTKKTVGRMKRVLRTSGVVLVGGCLLQFGGCGAPALILLSLLGGVFGGGFGSATP